MKIETLPFPPVTEAERVPQIGGFVKQSLVDFPGNISAVVFTVGCNLRCGYCHNPMLVLPEKYDTVQELYVQDICNWLEQNNQLLDAVTITGGEPTLHPLLPRFIAQLKELGLFVKLDTNGTNPRMIQQLLEDNLLDYIAMDIKSPFTLPAFQRVCGKYVTESMLDSVKQTVRLVEESSILHEFRITVARELHSSTELQSMIMQLQGKIYIQQVRTCEPVLNQNEDYNPVHESLLETLQSLSSKKRMILVR